ncbi:hypothetical protein E2L05_13230 [Meridianimarinicoccus aquatilis]|uniref:Uncharacterized protein n=2 Tax=Meridianimarinicoccus aquatilis TaxID=2552766 RepID=A0A4R6AR65_9RHOB|nr:hypothetical protein E2L05_13230 [Fluviibacterium aquatile]
MVMLIGLGLGMQVQVADAVTSPTGTEVSTVNDLAIANAIFDSGAARGANAADIPLTGTTDAADGAQIEARIVRADTGAEVHPWAVIATAAGGAWSGSFPAVQRSAYRLKAEVRVQGSAAAAGTMASDFMVGHVVVLIGQSEDARMFADKYDARTGGGAPLKGDWQSVPAFADDTARDSFFIATFGDAGEGETGSGTYEGNGIRAVSDMAPFTASVAHMANVVTRNAPGEKVLLINATQSGSSYVDLADDDDLDRNWNTSFADGVALVRSYGADVGVMMSSWTAAPSASGDGYRLRHYPLFTGMFAADDPSNPAGGTYVLDTDTATGENFDNLFWDLSGQNRAEAIFDAAVTRMAFHGPHRFEDNSGGTGGLIQQKQDTRISIRDWTRDAAVASIMLPKGPEIITYQNGSAANVNGEKVGVGDVAAVDWTDWSHPSDYSDDGLTARARHTGVAALYALGIGPSAAVNHEVPKFNRADWDASGAYVDLWYEASDGSTPAITTTRLARSEPPIPVTYNHRTEVAGFYINSEPAQRVEIVAGRVRVYPDGIAGAFDWSHTIFYGLGGASGIVQWPDDELDEIWKNLPIADVGFVGERLDGVAVEPMPLASDIANTLPAPIQFVTVAGSGPSFADPAGLGPNDGKLTFRVQVTPEAFGGGGQEILGQAGRVSLQRLNDGTMRVTLKDSTNTSLVGGTLSLAGIMPDNVFVDVVLALDLAGRRLRLFIDGVMTDDIQISASASGTLASNRSLNFFGSDSFGGAVGMLEVWKGYAPDGDTAALGAPYRRIAPDGAGGFVQTPGTSIWN